MKSFKGAKKFITIISLICVLISNFSIEASSMGVSNTRPLKIGVLLSNLDNNFLQQLKLDFENIQKENGGKVQFTIFNSQNSVNTQNQLLDSILRDGYDAIIAILVDTREEFARDFISRIKPTKIPLILFSVDPTVAKNVSKDYDKLAFVLADPLKAGEVQGEVISNFWNNKKSLLDKNGDGVLQYVILKGLNNEVIANQRTQGVLSALDKAGVVTKELKTITADWNEQIAQTEVENAIIKYDGAIEAIISNNDSMAIGAVKALQKYDFNKGNEAKYIPVFGIGGVPEAKDLIDKGFMTATVIEDTKEIANALFTVATNMINNLNPIENTNYTIKNGEIIIIEDPKPYITKNNI